MMKIKNRNVVIAFIVAVFMAITGLFCIGTNRRMTKAEESNETFSLVGMSLYVDKDSSGTGLAVNITEDIYNKINLGIFDPKGTVTSANYSLRVYRHPVGTSYHDSYEHWDFDKNCFGVDKDENGKIDQQEKGQKYIEDLYVSEGIFQFNLRNIPCPVVDDFSTEYNYTVSFRYNTTTAWVIHNTKTVEVTAPIKRSVSYVANRALNDSNFNWSDWQKDRLNWYQGIESENGEVYSVAVSYKAMPMFGEVQTITETYEVDSRIISDRNAVYYDIASRIHNSTHESFFNVDYYDENTGDSYTYLTVDGYTYNFDAETGKGTLTIEYTDFGYEDLAIFVQDNDTEDEINYTYVMRTTNRNFIETEDGVYCLTYNYSDMSTTLFRAFGWLVEFSADNFTYTIPSGVDVVVHPTATSLQIYFDEENEKDLANVFIYCNAEIIPDYECDVEIVYRDYFYDAGAIDYDENSQTITMWYSDMVSLGLKGVFADSQYFAFIEDGLIIHDQTTGMEFSARYAEYNGVTVGERQDGEERPKFIMTVQYTNNTLLEIKKYQDSNLIEISLLEVNPYSRYVYLDVGKSKRYQGRLSNIVIHNTMDAELHADYEYVENSYVKYLCGAHEEKIIGLSVYYKNTFLIDITYFEQYKTLKGDKTPFATQEVKTVEVNVSDYDLNNLTLDNVKGLLGKDDLYITELVHPNSNNIKINFSNPQKLTLELEYGYATLHDIDFNGMIRRQDVYLKPFSEYVKLMPEKTFDLMDLNYEEAEWYLTSNEISADRLYGLFAVSTFAKERTDINTLFEKFTHGGTHKMFAQKEVSGDVLYKFLNGVEGKAGPLLTPLLHSVLAFCEIANDKNETYCCYYTYLDGTSRSSFNGIGGADSADDDDNAMENAGQDIKDSINQSTEEFLKELKDIIGSFKPFEIDTDKLGMIFGTVGILAVVGILIFVLTRNNKPPKRRK